MLSPPPQETGIPSGRSKSIENCFDVFGGERNTNYIFEGQEIENVGKTSFVEVVEVWDVLFLCFGCCSGRHIL